MLDNGRIYSRRKLKYYNIPHNTRENSPICVHWKICDIFARDEKNDERKDIKGVCIAEGWIRLEEDREKWKQFSCAALGLQAGSVDAEWIKRIALNVWLAVLQVYSSSKCVSHIIWKHNKCAPWIIYTIFTSWTERFPNTHLPYIFCRFVFLENTSTY